MRTFVAASQANHEWFPAQKRSFGFTLDNGALSGPFAVIRHKGVRERLMTPTRALLRVTKNGRRSHCPYQPEQAKPSKDLFSTGNFAFLPGGNLRVSPR